MALLLPNAASYNFTKPSQKTIVKPLLYPKGSMLYKSFKLRKISSSSNPDIIKIGLSFFEAEETDFNDISETDVSLDFCVTPKRIYSF